MKKAEQQVSQSRRRFLRDAGLSGGAIAAAAAAPGVVLGETGQPPAEEAPREGYRLTQHILDYYKTAAS